MNIEKHGNRWRITEDRDGIRYRVSVDHKPSDREARDLIHERIREAEPNTCGKDTFEWSANKYIQSKSNILSPSTIRAYNSVLRNLSGEFKRMKTAAITQEQIQVEINLYAATHSPKSTRNAHGFISAVFRMFRPHMHISTTLPQKDKFEPYTPSEDEVKRILSDVSGTKYEIPYRLGCYGLRRGEICAITAADLDGNLLKIDKTLVYTDDAEWVIKPFPKTTESNREIFIDDDLAEMIKEQGFAYQENPERLSKHLKVVCRHLGIPLFRFHDMRAFYCSMAHALGISDAYIMANGGWSSTRIMDRVYKRTFAEKQAEANKSIADHLKP